jgi:hypothetical protein
MTEKNSNTPRALTSAKNTSRGALVQDAPEARRIIGSAFEALDATERSDFFEWITPLAKHKKKLFVTKLPAAWDSLVLEGIDETLDLEPQIDWCTRALIPHLAVLQHYVSKRAELEKQYLLGQFEAAMQLLDAIDKECGKSFWSLELHIGLLQDWKGLEAQKSFTAEIQSEHPRTPVAYIAALTSQRNEEKTNLNRFVDRVSGRNIPPPMKDLANYLLTKIPPDSSRSGGTLNAATNASPIDAYEALIDLVGHNRLTASSFLGSVHLDRLSLLYPLDWRLHRLASNSTNRFTTYVLPCQPPELPAPEALYRHNVEGTQSATPLTLKALERHAQIIRTIWHGNEITNTLLAEHEKNLVNHSGLSYFKILGSFYAVDRLKLGTDYVFHIGNAGQSLPGTSHLGSIFASDFKDGPPALGDDLWAAECIIVFSLCYRLALDQLVDALKALPTPASSLWVFRIGRLVAVSHAWAGQFEKAVDIVAELCVDRPDRSYLLPLGEMMPGQRWSDVSDSRAQIALPIFLSLLEKQSPGEASEKLLRVAFREFLRSAKVSRPSELASHASAYGKSNVRLILTDVALSNALDSVDALRKTRALEEERIAIYQALIDLDPANAGNYTNEIKQLTKLLNLADGLNDIDSSRIHVEYEPLYRLAEEQYGETFRRYAELRRASVGVGSAEEFDKALSDFIRGGSTTFEQLLDYPEQEGDVLLIEIVSGIMELFLYDPVHGLDIYLSMRIRHGSLATNLRAPLEARGLHVPEKQALPFGDILGNIPPTEIRSATAVLKEFTRRFEKAIASLLKERIQIRTGAGGNGLFDFSKTKLLIASARSRVEQDSTFRMLFDHVFETLAAYLGVTLKIVRHYIETDFRQEIEKTFDNLRRQLNSAMIPVAQAKITLAISQASPDIAATIERISNWFEVGGVPSGQLRTFDEIVDIGLLAVNRAHRNFFPNVTKNIEDLGPQSLITFNYTLDALFPLLENIAEHCGISAPCVDISVCTTSTYDEDGRVITVRVESDVAPGVDIEGAKQKLAEIRELISSGQYRQRVRGEGGTGLLKIQRMVSQSERQSLDFGFTPSNRFFAQFSMALRYLTAEKSKELGLA